MAKSIGIDDKELPFKASFPPSIAFREWSGLEFELSDNFNDNNDEDDDLDDENGVVVTTAGEKASEEDLLNFPAGIELDEEDVPVNSTNVQPRSESANEDELASRLVEEHGETMDSTPINAETVD